MSGHILASVAFLAMKEFLVPSNKTEMVSDRQNTFRKFKTCKNCIFMVPQFTGGLRGEGEREI
jgi:hypothetical protein